MSTIDGTRLEIRGARQHNLQNVDLDIPIDALVVLCGVSGSGKSSLAFDTVHAEGQRRYLEAVARDRGTTVLPPKVDRITGLPPTIALSQRDVGRPARSTVGSIAQVAPVLRVLFARAGTQHCPVCGRPIEPRTHDEIVSALLAWPEGTRLTIEAPVAGGTDPAVVAEVQRAGFSRLRLDDRIERLDELDPESLRDAETVRVVVDRVKVHPDRRSRLADSVRLAARAGAGVVMVVRDGVSTEVFVDTPRCTYDGTVVPALEPANLSPFAGPGSCSTCRGSGEVEGAPCPSCDGVRLAPAARAVRWRGRTLPELGDQPLAQLLEALPDGTSEVEQTSLADVRRRLGQLLALDLGHLVLDRAVTSLSGSEWQRLRLARQTANGLTGVLFVLDEPVAGLSPEHVPAVIALLRSLVAAGNGVLAVEHQADVIRAADEVVEFGPGAGTEGGRIVYAGSVDGLLAADTPTGRWLSGREALAPRDVEPAAAAVDVPAWGGRPDPLRLPRQRVVAITGPAASGKSRLLDGLGASLAVDEPRLALSGAEGLERAWVVSEGAGRVARSNPATYLGVWDRVRELLAATREAKIRGFTAGTFSLNTKGGRCAACKGTGELRIDMGPLPDVIEPCPVCEGRRFEIDVLEVRWKGHNAAELLGLSGEAAHALLAGHPQLDARLRAMVRVGLGYVPLGQSAPSLSGGEAMRLALAKELGRAWQRGSEDTVLLVDDPARGLHPADVASLLDLFRELTDQGATVWFATAEPGLAAAADERMELAAWER